jgi:uncharacterized membrane protein
MPETPESAVVSPFRRAILRGLAVILPPLLTVVVFLWAWNMIDLYILVPCEQLAGHVIVWSIKDIKPGIPKGAAIYDGPDGKPNKFEFEGTVYVPVGSGNHWIPERVWATVKSDENARATTPNEYYEEYARLAYLRRARTVPVFLAVFLLLLYMTGKVMAAGVGRFVWHVGEGVVHRMPVVRNVYSAVKQITDYVFSEQEVQFRRVVAVEYPRKDVWALAFVTGEGLKNIRDAVGEPVVALLVPTSPMPATGFACTVLQRETIELDITVEQALQFIVSCGVVVPPHQQWAAKPPREIGDEISRQVRESARIPASV